MLSHEFAAGDSGVIVNWLCNEGGDVNAREASHEETMLMLASAHGHVAIVDACLKHGANIHLEADDGYTALHRAAMYARTEIVIRLIDARADVRAVAKCNGNSVLCEAAAGGSFGKPLPVGDGSAGRPLPAAARDAEHVKIIKILVDAGADPNHRGTELTPLINATAKGRPLIVAALLTAGAKPTLKDAYGKAAIMYCARHDQATKDVFTAHETRALAETRAVHDAAAAASAGLARRRVMIIGLQSKPRLNGLCGSALDYEVQSGRIGVVLDQDYGDIRYKGGKPGAAVGKVKPSNLQLISQPSPLGLSVQELAFDADILEQVIDLETSTAKARSARNGFNNVQDQMLPRLIIISFPDMWPAPPGNIVVQSLAPKIVPVIQAMPDGPCVDEVELVHQLWYYRATLKGADEIVIVSGNTVKVEFGQIGGTPTEVVELPKPIANSYRTNGSSGIERVPEPTHEGFTRAELVAAVALHLQVATYGMLPASMHDIASPTYLEAKVLHPPGGGPPLTRLKLKRIVRILSSGICYLDLTVDKTDSFESGGGGWDAIYDRDT